MIKDKGLLMIIIASVCVVSLIIGIINIGIVNKLAKLQEKQLEQTQVREIFVCANNGNGFYNESVNRFKKDYPGIDVRFQGIDVSTGAPVTMSALIQAGTPPDIYEDFISRTGKYMVEGYAIDYTKYLNLDDFYEDVLFQMKRGKAIYGIPKTTRVVGMFVNTDITGPIPQDWTVDDFLNICAKVKATGKTPYVFFAGNQSSCEWLLGWFATFGCEYFKDGDYTKTSIKSTGGEKVFEFLLELLKAGYIPAESAVLTDDDAQAGFLNTTYAMSGSYIGSWDAAIQSQIEQGVIEKVYNYGFYGFPSDIGGKTPVIATYHAVVGHQSESEYKNKAIAHLANLMTDLQGIEMQGGSSFPSRASVKDQVDNVYWKRGVQIQKENGLYDVGISIAAYAGIRPALYPVVKELFNGNITTGEAIDMYEAAINKAIADSL